jgi:hypothetical protein
VLYFFTRLVKASGQLSTPFFIEDRVLKKDDISGNGNLDLIDAIVALRIVSITITVAGIRFDKSIWRWR